MSRRLAVLAVLLLTALALLVAVYFYGRTASCPPPDRWLDLSRQSDTYRCAG